ncbi:MAG: VOC family protein, partial [Gemmatimonadales bacterium]
MADDRHDRTTQDVGNIVALEHVNVMVPDQQLATLFYVVGLGLTRDPYLMTGLENMWINIGQQQFHLPTAPPQVLRGHVGLVIPDFDELPGRLAAVAPRLAGTRFEHAVEDKHIRVVSPWGNVIRCHPPGPAFGEMTLGMPYVEFGVEVGAADGIARFYRTAFGASAAVVRNGGGTAARVTVGAHQELIFRETAGA